MADDSKDKKTPKTSDKVFDVAHPSKTTADKSAKPVIVGHTNAIKNDPMMAEKTPEKTEDQSNAIAEEAKKAEESLSAKNKAETKIEPLEEPKENEVKAEKQAESDYQSEDKPETDQNKPDETDSLEKAEQTVENETEDEEPKKNEPSEEVEDSNDADKEAGQVPDSTGSEGALNTVVDGVNTKKERIEAENKQAQIDEEIKGLINSKKFNVKINTPPKTRKIRWLVLLLFVFILAGVAWYLTSGPGKDLWIKDSTSNSQTPVAQAPVSQDNNQKPAEEEKTEENKTFTTENLPLSFAYPANWERRNEKR